MGPPGVMSSVFLTVNTTREILLLYLFPIWGELSFKHPLLVQLVRGLATPSGGTDTE